MEHAPAGGGAGAVATPPPVPTCPVCMEPWTCNGDHRICCIPCGHVYGRSCLERWLQRSSDSGAKCPQCGEQFERNLITNLYAPGNLWDDSCRFQEVKAHRQSEVCDIGEEITGCLSGLREKALELSSVLGNLGEVIHEMEEEKATTKANLTTMKERMRKMAEEEKATAMDLMEFMELSFLQLPLFSEDPQASDSAPAPVDAENNTRRRSNRVDQLPPVPEPPGPADAVNESQASGSAPAPVHSQNNTRRRSNRLGQRPPVPESPGPAAGAVNRRRRRGP